MQGKYMVLALLVTCHHVTLAHILTSAHVDVPLAACIKFLASTVVNELCPLYGEHSSEEYEDIRAPRPIEPISLHLKEKIIETCCTRPCTMLELITIC